MKVVFIVAPVTDNFAVALRLEAPVPSNSTLPLERIPSIYYLLYFKKIQAKIQALINSDNEVNTMTPAYVKKLCFCIRKTDIGVQKINNSIFETFKMVLANF